MKLGFIKTYSYLCYCNQLNKNIMSTNATIGIKVSSLKMKSIYLHWAGYPSDAGKTLLKFYDTQEKVNELINMGNVSILGEIIGTKTDFDSFDSRNQIQSLFYSRDREETDQEAVIHDFRALNHTREYNYLFKDNAWYYRKYKGNFKKLTLEVCELD